MKSSKKTINPKSKRKTEEEPKTNSESGPPPGDLVECPEGGLTIRPYPADLLEEADQEPDHVDLAEYFEVIAKLREKGFSFREIAEWLGERNIAADHNAVYRVYTSHMTIDEMRVEADLEARERHQRGGG